MLFLLKFYKISTITLDKNNGVFLKRVQWLLKFRSDFLKKYALKLRTTDYNAILFLFYHDANIISHELEIKPAPEIECFH